MINVSSAFKQAMGTRTNFYCYAEFTLTDGTQLILSKSDFTATGNAFGDGAGVSTLPLGVAIEKYVKLSIMNAQNGNYDGVYDDYNFYGAQVDLYLRFELTSSSYEEIFLGKYTVTNPATMGDVITMTAYDAMWKADREFTTTISFPCDLQTLLNYCCQKCGFTLVPTLSHGTYVVKSKPENCTYRQVIGWIAGIEGGNARISHLGNLEVVKYKRLSGETAIVDQAIANKAIADSTSSTGAYSLRAWSSLTVDTDDIVINGICYKKKVESTTGGTKTVSDVSYICKFKDNSNETEVVEYTGDEGYVLSIENQLIAGNEDVAVNYMFDVMSGITIRKFNGTHIANPLVEFMDLVTVTDRKGNSYGTVITDVEFSFAGYTTYKNSAESYVDSGKVYSASKAIITAQSLVDRERTEREEAILDMNNKIASAAGMYVSKIDGVTYAHDQKTLAESKVVWVFNSSGFSVTNDWKGSVAETTWDYGFTVDGQLIVNAINASQINSKWIKTDWLITDKIQDKNGNNWIDLKEGEFKYGDANSGDYISWQNGALTIHGIINAINNDPTTATKISGNKINLDGTVTFSSFNTETQSKINSAISAGETVEALQTVRTSDTSYYLATDRYDITEDNYVEFTWTTNATSATMSKEKPYLWIYHEYSLVNGGKETTPPVLVGRFGSDGETTSAASYKVYIRYAENEQGTGMSTTPNSRTAYIGFSTTTNTIAPTDAGAYTWSKYVGEVGSRGKSILSISTEPEAYSGSIANAKYRIETPVVKSEAGMSEIVVGDMLQSNGYLYTVISIAMYGSTEFAYTGDRVQLKGDNGTSVTVTSTTTEYAVSDSGTSTPQSWQSTIPVTGKGNYLWTKITTTYSSGPASVAYTKAYQGMDGIGTNGTNSTLVMLFMKAETAPDNGPSASTTYKFSTGKLSGSLGNWSQTYPEMTDRDKDWPRYVTTAMAISNTDEANIQASSWTTPTVYVQSIKGETGDDGYNRATIYLYKRTSDSTVYTPSGNITYTFSSGEFSVPTGWSKTIESGDDPLYVTSAVAVSNNGTATITHLDWSTPALMSKDGEDGKNSATVTLYKRSTTVPNKPSANVTYTFSTSTATGMDNGWTQEIPSGDDPCYVTMAVACSSSETDEIAPTEWKAPQKISENGYNRATIFLYKRADSTPSSITATDMVYTFSTDSLSNIPNGLTWSRSIPDASGGKRCYVSSASAFSRDDSVTITSWTAPIVFVEDGAKGEQGNAGKGISKTTNLYIAKSTQTPVPTAPSSKTSLGSWSSAQPSLSSANPYIYTCTMVEYDNGDVSFSSVVMDKTLSAMAGWCSAENSTQIDGSKIYAGSIAANQINVSDLAANTAFINSLSAQEISFENGYYAIKAQTNVELLSKLGNLTIYSKQKNAGLTFGEGSTGNGDTDALVLFAGDKNGTRNYENSKSSVVVSEKGTSLTHKVGSSWECNIYVAQESVMKTFSNASIAEIKTTATSAANSGIATISGTSAVYLRAYSGSTISGGTLKSYVNVQNSGIFSAYGSTSAEISSPKVSIFSTTGEVNIRRSTMNSAQTEETNGAIMTVDGSGLTCRVGAPTTAKLRLECGQKVSKYNSSSSSWYRDNSVYNEFEMSKGGDAAPTNTMAVYSGSGTEQAYAKLTQTSSYVKLTISANSQTEDSKKLFSEFYANKGTTGVPPYAQMYTQNGTDKCYAQVVSNKFEVALNGAVKFLANDKGAYVGGYKFDCGVFTVVTEKKTDNQYLWVKFNTEFSEKPRVVISQPFSGTNVCIANGTANTDFGEAAVNTQGFTIAFAINAAVSRQMFWMAMGK